MPRPQNEKDNVQYVNELSEVDGPFQSPIDINFYNIIRLELPPLAWNKSDAVPIKMKVTNTGHTVMVSGKWKCEWPYLTGGPLTGNYVFSQIHFHWGPNDSRGSEHKVNGESFPFEMHVNHFKTEYGTQEMALRERDGMAVVVYLFKLQDEPNPNFKKVLNALPCVQKANTSQRIEPRSILSFCNPFTDDYFAYWGSSVTKTCAHVLLWLICREPFGISKEQISEFRKVLDLTNRPIRRNHRDVKPLHRRSVFHVNASANLDQPMLPIKNVEGCFCVKSNENRVAPDFFSQEEKRPSQSCMCDGEIEGKRKDSSKRSFKFGPCGPNTVVVQHVTVHPSHLSKKMVPFQEVDVKKFYQDINPEAWEESKTCCFNMTRDDPRGKVNQVKSRREKTKCLTKRKKSFNSITALTKIIDSLEAFKNETYEKLRDIEVIRKDIKSLKGLCRDMKEKRWLRKAGKIMSRQKRFTIRSSQLCFSSLNKLAKECDFDQIIKENQNKCNQPRQVFWFGKHNNTDEDSTETYSNTNTKYPSERAKAILTFQNHEKFSKKAQKVIQSYLEEMNRKDELRRTVKQSLEDRKMCKMSSKSREAEDAYENRNKKGIFNDRDEIYFENKPPPETPEAFTFDVKHGDGKPPLEGSSSSGHFEKKTRKKSLTKFTEVSPLKYTCSRGRKKQGVIPLRRTKVEHILSVDHPERSSECYTTENSYNRSKTYKRENLSRGDRKGTPKYKTKESSESDDSYTLRNYPSASQLPPLDTVTSQISLKTKKNPSLESNSTKSRSKNTTSPKARKLLRIGKMILPEQRLIRKEVWPNESVKNVSMPNPQTRNVLASISTRESDNSITTKVSSELSLNDLKLAQKKFQRIPKWNRLTTMRHQFIRAKLSGNDSPKESTSSPERKKMKYDGKEKNNEVLINDFIINEEERNKIPESLKIIDFNRSSSNCHLGINPFPTISEKAGERSKANKERLESSIPSRKSEVGCTGDAQSQTEESKYYKNRIFDPGSDETSSERECSFSKDPDSSSDKKKVAFSNFTCVCSYARAGKKNKHKREGNDNSVIKLDKGIQSTNGEIEEKNEFQGDDEKLNAEESFQLPLQKLKVDSNSRRFKSVLDKQRRKRGYLDRNLNYPSSHFKNKIKTIPPRSIAKKGTNVEKKTPGLDSGQNVLNVSKICSSSQNTDCSIDSSSKLLQPPLRFSSIRPPQQWQQKHQQEQQQKLQQERQKSPCSLNSNNKNNNDSGKTDQLTNTRTYFHCLTEDEKLKLITENVAKFIEEKLNLGQVGLSAETNTNSIKEVKQTKMVKSVEKNTQTIEGSIQTDNIPSKPFNFIKLNRMMAGKYRKETKKPEDISNKPENSKVISPKMDARDALSPRSNKTLTASSSRRESVRSSIPTPNSPWAKPPKFCVDLESPRKNKMVKELVKNNQRVKSEAEAIQSTKKPKQRKKLVPTYLVTSCAPTPPEVVQNQKREMNRYLIHTDVDGYFSESKDPQKSPDLMKKEQLIKGDDINVNELEYLFELDRCIHNELATNMENSMIYVRSLLNQEYNGSAIIEKPPLKDSLNIFDCATNGIVYIEMNDSLRNDSNNAISVSDEGGKDAIAKSIEHVLNDTEEKYLSESSCDCEVSITVNAADDLQENSCVVIETETDPDRNPNEVSQILKKYIYHLGRGEESNIDLAGKRLADTEVKPENAEPQIKKRKNRKLELSRDMKQRILKVMEEMNKKGKESSLSETSSNHSLLASQYNGTENTESLDSDDSGYQRPELKSDISDVVQRFLDNYNENYPQNSNEQDFKSSSHPP